MHCSSSYNNMSNGEHVKYNTNINNLLNSDLFNFILIRKHTLINILCSMKYIFHIFINIYISIK